MFGFDHTRYSLLRRARWIAAGVSALLILFALLVNLGVAVDASLLLVGQTQGEGTPAPSAPIRPVSVSVINLAELAAQDAKVGKQLQSNATPILIALPPPREITEVDAESERPTTAASGTSDLIQPLISSPAPSQSFLAQEDAPQTGTGTFAIPPDTTGAVGTDKLFVTVNNNYRVQDKLTGAALSTVSINTFWSSTGASGVFDPRVQYDPYNNRWIVAAISNSRSADSSVLVGISATSDPQGTFTLFRFVVGCAAGAMNCDANGETADFPMLGLNKNWVAIGWNQFQIGGSNSLVAGKMLALDYPTLRSGTSNSTVFTVTIADNPAAFAMHPATTLSATEDTLYVPAHLSSAGATYRLHKLIGTPSAPVYMLDTVSRTRTGGGWTPPGGDILPQTCVGTPGTTCPTTLRSIESVDAFIRSNVVFRNGNIWYAQTIALPAGGLGQSNTHTAAQWTRIDTSGNFVDGGRVEDTNATATNGGEWYAYPSIAVNVNDDALLGFSNFASIHFARAGYTVRLGADAAGTMRDPVIFKEGEDYYSKDFGGSRNRWGDYSNSLVDPANDTDLWTIQEYAAARVIQDNQQTTNASRWGTWWAKVPANGPLPSPTPTVSPTPAGCPTTLVVTANGDGDDAAPGNRVCATGAGVCTLRAAIEEANALTSCGTIDITFSGVTSPITLGIGLPDINHNVNINGPGANQLTVMRSTVGGIPNFRIFTIPSNRTVNISGLTMSNGAVSGSGGAGSGGAIGNGGTLTLTNLTLSGNRVTAGSGGGGAIFNNGTLTLSNSTVTGNSVTAGSAQGGGGVYTGGTLKAINSTVSGNLASTNGGGIYSANGGMTLTNVTVTNNRCNADDVGFDGGGGIQTLGGNATLKNTLVASNFRGSTGTDPSDFDGGGGIGGTVVSSSSFNLFGTGGSSGLTNGVNNNQVGVSNPGLGSLANNGGPTMTHSLSTGSPAINAGSNALAVDQNNNPLTTDQRGAGFNRIAGGTVDIGAFELQPGEIPPTPTPTPTPTATPTPKPTPTPTPCFTFTVNNNGDSSDATPGDALCLTVGGACTLRAAIQEANALSGCGTIDINLSGVTSPITLPTALPNINHNVNINGPGANQLTVQRSTVGGTPNFRIFTIGTNRTVTITNLTMSNGNVGGGDGGAIDSDGTLILIGCNFFGNSSGTGRGGAIYFHSSTGLMNSLVVSNSNIGGTAAGQPNVGSGLQGAGNLTMTGGSIAGNQGGGLNFSGRLALNGVAITDNASLLDGGGITFNETTLDNNSIVNCLISNNTAIRDGAGLLFNSTGSTVSVINSTISGNRGGGKGAGLENFGRVTLVNTTITNNRSDSDNSGGEQGGGIDHSGGGNLILNNTMVAGNFRGGSSTTADDISGTVNSSSASNVIGTGGSGGLANGVNNNRVGVSNPGLGPLANNGGPTMTHALLPGSPAIDAGSNALALDQNNNPLITDQRGAGFNRIVNGTVDIGAFEVQSPPPTVQFGAPSFNVNEADKQVSITVARVTGGSGPFTVDFTTSDTAGTQNCNVFNGKASSRCDYISVIGTLSFAAGENLKIVSILIIDDSYAEGPETLAVNLSNPIGANLGAQSTATVTINDNEASSGANPIDQANVFVRQHYLDFLNREPDASGLAFWTNQITECQQAGATCNAEVRRINVSAAFFLSIEFQETGYLVERLYKSAYGDAIGTSNFGPIHQLTVPVVRFNEFLPDTQQIGQGVIVGQTGWETVLENNKQTFTAEFVVRTRFTTAFPTTLMPAQFVDMLFANAGVVPSTTDRNAAIAEFGAATNTANTAARARALRRVAENTTLNQQEFNRAFVLMQYYGYLRRNPNELPDSDYSGYDFWLTKLNQFNGNFQNAEMVKAFILSGEYRQRFGP